MVAWEKITQFDERRQDANQSQLERVTKTQNRLRTLNRTILGSAGWRCVSATPAAGSPGSRET